jgi:hypothetical protein
LEKAVYSHDAVGIDASHGVTQPESKVSQTEREAVPVDKDISRLVHCGNLGHFLRVSRLDIHHHRVFLRPQGNNRFFVWGRVVQRDRNLR